MIDIAPLSPMLHASRPLALLTAQGLLDNGEALAALTGAAEAAGIRSDRSGWQCRLHWVFAAQLHEAETARKRARWAVRDAIAPLLVIRPRVPAAAIIAEAREAGRPLLLARETQQIAEAEMARALRGQHGK